MSNSRPWPWRSWFFALLILLQCGQALAADSEISGTATDVTGAPLAHVWVYVPEAQRGAHTDLDGLFAIKHLAPGRYTVLVWATNYVTLELKDVEVQSGSVKTMIFRMRLLGGYDEPVPVRTFAMPPDSAVRVAITPAFSGSVRLLEHRSPPPWIDVALRNNGPDTLVLVLPGAVGRTPILGWTVRTSDGLELAPATAAQSEHRSALISEDIFELAPGQSRQFELRFPTEYEYKPGKYQVRLTYENRPSLLGGEPGGQDDPEAVKRLRSSTPCKVTSNALEVKIE